MEDGWSIEHSIFTPSSLCYAPAFGRQGHGHCNSEYFSVGRNVPRKPRLVSGVKGHNMNEISFPGSPALWAGSFTFPYKFNRF
jgi:hypothetical protein